MYKIIVNSLGKFKFGILPAIERRQLIFFAYINMPPVIKRFYVVHRKILPAKINEELKEKKLRAQGEKEVKERY
jgi:hypothetical protein